MAPPSAALASRDAAAEHAASAAGGSRPRAVLRGLRRGVLQLLDPLLLTTLVLWLGSVAGAFSGTPKGYDAFGHIAKSRFLVENWPHVSWNYSWYSGMPTFQGSYPPGYHGLVALLAGPLGLGVPRAMNAVALGAMLALVLGCYATVRTATSSRRWALGAGALLLGTPALWSHAVETGLFPRLLGMGCTALALAAATRFAVRGGRVMFVLAVLATAGALSSHVVAGGVALALLAGVLLVGSREDLLARVLHAGAATAGAAAVVAYFYLPFAVLGGSQTPFTDAVTELGWRELWWPARGSVSALSPLLVGGALVAGVAAVRGLRSPSIALRDRLALGLDLPWLTHPAGPVPPGATPAVLRWDAWRRRTETAGFPLRLAVLLLSAFPAVLAYGTIGYVAPSFPFFVGGLQPPDLLGYLAVAGATAVGLVGGSVRWPLPARLRQRRTSLRVAGLVLAGAGLAAAITGTAAMLPAATRGNAAPDDPATASWLSPAWSEQRQLRVAGATDSTTNVVNAVSRVPQTRGYQANGSLALDWQVWLEQSQLDPRTTPAERGYLLDWHAVGWVLADDRTASLGSYTAHPDRFTPAGEDGAVHAFTYRHASPVLGASDAPTVLVVGDTGHYDLVLRALSLGGIDSRALLTVQGPASVDELTPADLDGADTVFLYGATLHDPTAANALLRGYLGGGGRLVVDDADGSLTSLADRPDSVLPVRGLRTRTVRDEWRWRSPPDPVTAGIDLTAFGPPSYDDSDRWDVQGALGVQRWARPLLSSTGVVVSAIGEVGRGESAWSGIGLPYHAASFRSAAEAALLGRLLDAREPAPPPAAEARFVNSQRREVTVGADAAGVLFKERHAPGWHASAGGHDLRIRPAGPGMMYVALPPGHERTTVVLSYSTGPVEVLGYAVSLLALAGGAGWLARRSRWWARAAPNA